MKFLEWYEEIGFGGIFFDDIWESLFDVDEVVKLVGCWIMFIICFIDKKVILFFKNE